MSTLSRRSLLQLAALLAAQGAGPLRALARPEQRTLVLVELQGGNDGLNTLIPYEDEYYHKLRPRLAIRQPLPLRDGMGMHPALAPLLPAWQAGELCWVRGLGYRYPNRSHFRSIEIWETASGSRQRLQQGWLARVLPKGGNLQGIIIGDDAGPLADPQLNVVIMKHLDRFLRDARRFRELAETTSNPALAHVLRIHDRIHDNARLLSKRLRRTPSLQADFPNTAFGRSMETAARILVAGIRVPVLKVGIMGFDTHINQKPRHARRLKQLADGLAAFRSAMQKAGLWEQVLIATYSEFGRRAAENASGGTDHGTAAPHIVMGGRVRGGFAGQQPSLARLDENGDPSFTVDFRSLYHTLSTRWLQRPSSPWKRFGTLALVD